MCPQARSPVSIGRWPVDVADAERAEREDLCVVGPSEVTNVDTEGDAVGCVERDDRTFDLHLWAALVKA